MKYSDLSNGSVLKEDELLSLEGGYLEAYGCESNVCLSDRSGAKGLCTDAYCKSGVGPAHPSTTSGTKESCTLFSWL